MLTAKLLYSNEEENTNAFYGICSVKAECLLISFIQFHMAVKQEKGDLNEGLSDSRAYALNCSTSQRKLN